MAHNDQEKEKQHDKEYSCGICGKQILLPQRLQPKEMDLLCPECFFRLKDYEYMMVNYGNAISEYLNNDEYDIKYSNSRINAKYRKEILEFQDNKCAICGCELNIDTAKLDHDHNTGFVRGVLCNGCNPKLGAYEMMLKYKDKLDNYFGTGGRINWEYLDRKH